MARSEAQTRAVKVPSHSSHCTFASCRCAPQREHEVESSKFKLNTVSKRCQGTCALTRGCSHGHGHLAHRVYHARSHRPCLPSGFRVLVWGVQDLFEGYRTTG
jgi:hypothetical protein